MLVCALSASTYEMDTLLAPRPALPTFTLVISAPVRAARSTVISRLVRPVETKRYSGVVLRSTARPVFRSVRRRR